MRGGENDNLDSLTVEQVAQKLKLMGLQDKHVKKFKKNKIDGVLLQVGKAVQFIHKVHVHNLAQLLIGAVW
jgi:hypothetical protein